MIVEKTTHHLAVGPEVLHPDGDGELGTRLHEADQLVPSRLRVLWRAVPLKMLKRGPRRVASELPKKIERVENTALAAPFSLDSSCPIELKKTFQLLSIERVRPAKVTRVGVAIVPDAPLENAGVHDNRLTGVDARNIKERASGISAIELNRATVL